MKIEKLNLTERKNNLSTKEISYYIEENHRYANNYNEYEEYEDVYQNFADIAKQEGFIKVEQDFRNIAEIEKMHGDRFSNLVQGLENNDLYQSLRTVRWMCLNCGFIYEGTHVPSQCPVCSYEQGYFIRLNNAPYTTEEKQ